MGDIALESEDISNSIHTIENFMKELYKTKSEIIPIMIGGDHFCTYPTLTGIGKSINTDDVGIIVFDAHLDFYNTWKDNTYSHATITHRLFDLDWVNRNNLLVVGTRDIDIPEKELAEKYNLHYLNAYELNNNIEAYIQRIINFFHSNNIERLYLSIDIDVLDPSAAPGTGYAIPGGFSYRELWTILRKLTTFFSVIGFDMVEVAPNLDLSNNVTCTIAAKIIIELISFIQNL
jgi:arginase family enzyme